MLSKLTLNIDSNVVEDILNSLKPEARKLALYSIKHLLKDHNVRLHSNSDIFRLAEENLTIKELRQVFRNSANLKKHDADEIMNLKAYYLTQRIKRNSATNERLRKSITRQLKKAMLEKAIISEVDVEAWKSLIPKERRKKIIFYAANYLDYLLLEDIFNSILTKEHVSNVTKEARNIDFMRGLNNNEILPFLQRLIIHERELKPEDIQEALETIIEQFISDFPSYKAAATQYLSLRDVYRILERRICLPDRQGKIGQKAAGMILAYKILNAEKNLQNVKVKIPESFYLTSDVFFESLSSHSYNFSTFRHKLKKGAIADQQMFEEYPKIRDMILKTELPNSIRIELRRLLSILTDKPIIVRSSSLLEDSASAFSGKYDSYFFANQPLDDDPEVDLELRVDRLVENILKVYASALHPEALIYRRERGLLDIDERMCVLIQVVEGKRYGKYFFPAIAGVGLSHNHRTNTEKIKWNDPLLRIGVGLGTGVVEVRGNQVKVVYPGKPDYTLVFSYFDILKSSQRNIDVLNIVDDRVETLTKNDLFHYMNNEQSINPRIRRFIQIMGRFLLSTKHQDYLTEGIGLETKLSEEQHIVTLAGLRNTDFYAYSDWALRVLAEKYQPSDMEFTLCFPVEDPDADPDDERHDFEITVVQCRQLTGSLELGYHKIPTDLPEQNILCSISKDVGGGYAPNIDYVVYIDPEKYYKLEQRHQFTVARYIGHLNFNLRDERFILVGPGRWGSSTPSYGVKVNYTEIYHTQALVEIARKISDDQFAETSLGSHFGNDIRESQIVNFGIYPGTEGTRFKSDILTQAPNQVYKYFEGIPLEEWVNETIRLIDVKTLPSDSLNEKSQTLHIIGNSEKQQGIIFLAQPLPQKRRITSDPRIVTGD